MYDSSIEEHRYVYSIKREKEYFEKLLKSNKNLAICLSDLPEDVWAVRKEQDGRLVPEMAVYRVVLDLTDDAQHTTGELRRGTVHIEGDRVSPIERIWRRVVAVVMREAGP